MRHLALGLLALALAGSACAGADDVAEWKAKEARDLAAREKFSEQLLTLKVTRLFRIDPIATVGNAPSDAPRFHDWLLVASAAPPDADSQSAISRSLAAVVASHKDGQDACFAPHHGLTLTDGKQSFDVLLCFDCTQYIVFSSDGARVFSDSFSARREKLTWEQVFRAAGLPEERRRSVAR